MADAMTTVTSRVDGNGVARITLNRPERRNAMTAQMIGELTEAIREASADNAVRCLLLAGEGKVFCAGADLNWLGDVAGMNEAELREDSRRLQDLLRALSDSPKLTIARVQGAAMAGGLGLVACCDAVVALAGTQFSVSEVRLGLVPGIISGFLLPRLGAGRLRYEALTGRVFSTDDALRSGLVHAVAESGAALDDLVEQHIGYALAASPDAIADCKLLLNDVEAGIDAGRYDQGLAWNVKARRSKAGQEGVTAFLAKRPADWVR